jgi:rRNA maturation endonuclease Nob1
MADRYIIDTNVILQHPEVLARTGGTKLVIPQAVLEELQHARVRGVRGGVRDVLAEAIGKGVHVASPPATLKQEWLVSDRNAQRLSGADIAIAQLAVDYAERMGPQAVSVVTTDRALAKFLSSKGIASITGAEFLSEPSLGKADNEIEVTAKTIVSKQRRYVFISFVLGAIASLLGKVAFSKIEYLISTISVWGTLVALPPLGVLLFWCRERFRFSYGIFEFFVGMMIAYRVFFPNFNYSQVGAVDAIQILGGLYVMVRGLDNIGKGLEGTRFEPFWRRLLQLDAP